MILGHAHVPGLLQGCGKTYLNTGDLHEHFTYGHWHAGRWALRDAHTGQPLPTASFDHLPRFC